MRIKDLSICNMRLFGGTPTEIKFSKEKNISILLGNNSSGKTTILDAISFIISSFVGSFPGCTIKNLADKDVHIEEDNRMAPSLEIDASLLSDGAGNEL